MLCMIHAQGQVCIYWEKYEYLCYTLLMCYIFELSNLTLVDQPLHNYYYIIVMDTYIMLGYKFKCFYDVLNGIFINVIR